MLYSASEMGDLCFSLFHALEIGLETIFHVAVGGKNLKPRQDTSDIHGFPAQLNSASDVVSYLD